MLGLKALVGNRTDTDPGDDVSPDPEFAAEMVEDASIDADIGKAMDQIESDIGNAVRSLCTASDAVKSKVAEKIKLINSIKEDTNVLAEHSGEATESATKLAAALGELVSASNQIGEQVQESSEMAAAAETIADEASQGIAELSSAVSEIEEVVKLISSVANQTNLLALNATIEAARAGEAGRGFAVVANEVKSLSVETQKATDEIANNIHALQQSAERSIGAVNRVIEQIGRIRPVFDAVNHSVEEQVATTGSLGSSAHSTSAFVREVAERADAIRIATDAAAQVGIDVDAEARSMMSLSEGMGSRLVMMIRQTPVGERRQSDRLPVEIGGTATAGSVSLQILTVDLSEGGLLFKTDASSGLAPGTRIELRLNRIGDLAARIVARSDLGFHCAFENRNGAAYDAVLKKLEEIRRENEVFIKRAVDTAARISEGFEAALARREISERDLFDTAYQPIPETNPLQYSVPLLDFFERMLPDIQEPLLASDKRMALCIAVDLNGYLPVHNKIYSKPQKPDDPIWNAANCRNKRIFDDRAGLSGARNIRPYLVQSYPRDMGNGTIIWMKEVDAPIIVNGRHWGGFRTAYKM